MITDAARVLRARQTRLIPLTKICREPRPWHAQIHVDEENLARLVAAVESTGEITPVRVIAVDEGYHYVSGIYQLRAAERLGIELLPAFVEEEHDAEFLLRTVLIEHEMKFPLKTLERGWALRRLMALREERGLPHLQVDLAKATQIDIGAVSLGLKAAAAISEVKAAELAANFSIPSSAIATLPRSPLRRIARADSELAGRMITAACRALAREESPTRAVISVVESSSPTLARDRVRRVAERVLTAWRRFLRVLLDVFREFGDWDRGESSC